MPSLVGNRFFNFPLNFQDLFTLSILCLPVVHSCGRSIEILNSAQRNTPVLNPCQIMTSDGNLNGKVVSLIKNNVLDTSVDNNYISLSVMLKYDFLFIDNLTKVKGSMEALVAKKRNESQMILSKTHNKQSNPFPPSPVIIWVQQGIILITILTEYQDSKLKGLLRTCHIFVTQEMFCKLYIKMFNNIFIFFFLQSQLWRQSFMRHAK